MQSTTEIMYTSILLIVIFIINYFAKRGVKKFTLLRQMEINRKKIIFKLIHLVEYIVIAIGLAIIWGIDMKQFSVFISSVLAVLGVGFFAQWSLLSNLTASVILFFSHPLRLGDRIRILDKDFDWTGRVIDITGFYLFMKTDDDRNLTIPNYLVLQKGIEILENKTPE